MTKLLIVNNSMRAASAGDKIADFVKDIASKHEAVEPTIVNLRDINLPFYNEPMTPAMPEYKITNPAAQVWQKHVQQADAIVTLTPEYNFGMAAAQKNAIDWLFAEWDKKPVVAVGYGWGGGQKALPHLNDVKRKVGANILADEAASLYFTKTIDLSGEVIDRETASAEIDKAVTAVVAAATARDKTYSESSNLMASELIQ